MSQLDLYTQWMTVLLMLFSGLAMGVAYDSFRVAAVQLKFPRWTLPCLDILYWLAATWFVFNLLVEGNQGQLRFYVFLGLAIGAWLYYILLSRLTVRLTTGLLIAIKATIRFILRIGYLVIIVPIKTLFLFLLKLFRIVGKVAIFLLKFVLKLAHPLWRLARWICAPLVMPLWNRWQMTDKLKRLRACLIRAWHSVSDVWYRVKNRYVKCCDLVLGWFKRPPD